MEDSIDSFPSSGNSVAMEVVVEDEGEATQTRNLFDTIHRGMAQNTMRWRGIDAEMRLRERRRQRGPILNTTKTPQTSCTNKMLGNFRFLCDSDGDCSCERPTQPLSFWKETNREAPSECRLRSLDHGAVLAQDNNAHALILNREHLKSVQDAFAMSTNYLNAEYRALKRLGAATRIGAGRQNNFELNKLISYKRFLSDNLRMDRRILGFVAARIDSPEAKLTKLWAAHRAKRITLDAALTSALASSEELLTEMDAIYTEMLTGTAPVFCATSSRYAQRAITAHEPWYCPVCMRGKPDDPRREDWPTCMVDLGCGVKQREASGTVAAAAADDCSGSGNGRHLICSSCATDAINTYLLKQPLSVNCTTRCAICRGDGLLCSEAEAEAEEAEEAVEANQITVYHITYAETSEHEPLDAEQDSRKRSKKRKREAPGKEGTCHGEKGVLEKRKRKN